jgi:hypothetical protein
MLQETKSTYQCWAERMVHLRCTNPVCISRDACCDLQAGARHDFGKSAHARL